MAPPRPGPVQGLHDQIVSFLHKQATCDPTSLPPLWSVSPHKRLAASQPDLALGPAGFPTPPSATDAANGGASGSSGAVAVEGLPLLPAAAPVPSQAEPDVAASGAPSASPLAPLLGALAVGPEGAELATVAHGEPWGCRLRLSGCAGGHSHGKACARADTSACACAGDGAARGHGVLPAAPEHGRRLVAGPPAVPPPLGGGLDAPQTSAPGSHHHHGSTAHARCAGRSAAPPSADSPTAAVASLLASASRGAAPPTAHAAMPSAAAFLPSLIDRAEEPGPVLDRDSFSLLMSAASSYKPAGAALPGPPAVSDTEALSAATVAAALRSAEGRAAGARAAPMRPGRGGAAVRGVEAPQWAPAAAAAQGGGAAAACGAGCTARAGAGVLKSPESLLGLTQLGLEGWRDSSRRWEREHEEAEAA